MSQLSQLVVFSGATTSLVVIAKHIWQHHIHRPYEKVIAVYLELCSQMIVIG